MSLATQIFAASFLSISTCICWLCCILFSLYLRKKPLGMQTLLDKFISTFIKVYLLHITILNTLLYFMVFPIPFPAFWGKSCYFLLNFNYNHFLLWLLTMVAFKYLTIYHPSWVDYEKLDSQVINSAKLAILLINILLFLLEHGILSQAEDSTVFKLLTEEKDKPHGEMPSVTRGLTIMAILSVFCMQTMLEFKRYQVNEENLTFLRFVSFLIVLCTGYVMFYLGSLNFSHWNGVNMNIMVNTTTIALAFSVLPPVVFVINHVKLRDYAKSVFSNLI